MEHSKKIVTSIPIDKFWTYEEDVDVSGERYLTKREIQEILNSYPVEFVVVDIGKEIQWISVDKYYEFRESKAKKNIAEDYSNIETDKFPNEFAFVASEWNGNIQTPLILLEKYH